MEEIVNRVANSALQVFDLEDYFPEGPRFTIDVSQWLYEGFVLREKDFREQLKNYDWETYKNGFVALSCSTDAIVPAWAFMLITAYLEPVAQKVFWGTIPQMEIALYQELLQNLDYTAYQDKPVIIKGCSKKPVPQEVYVLATQKLMPIAKSIMFGEACSAVPVYKRK
ncbi:DUF2480 family protein [Flavobacterium cerinum]|uniref:DUF2480 family protein n=1 Tax=Flavobacterium cerinum TaxID=2502784 RepID=A0ABY5IX89_9FLAO|nr:DUF2480 family protein [Flavobacterium cerinum]UUC46353.1 DUF2480 family protein [Flavobacterium cerinum]